MRPERQPTTPADRRASNKNLFWYSACVRMIRMAIMQGLISTVSWPPVCGTIENYLRQPRWKICPWSLQISHRICSLKDVRIRGGIRWVVSQLVEQPVSLTSQMYISLTDVDGPRTSWAVSFSALSEVIFMKLRPTVNIEDNCDGWDVTVLRIFKWGWKLNGKESPHE